MLTNAQRCGSAGERDRHSRTGEAGCPAAPILLSRLVMPLRRETHCAGHRVIINIFNV
jgi:hypothetical protein